MNLYTSCNHCGEKHKFRKKYSTRVDFKMNEGPIYTATCKNCRGEINRNLNEINATYSIPTILILLCLSITVSIVAYIEVINYNPNFTPAGWSRPIYTLPIFPIIVLLIYRSYAMSRVNTFNKVRI